MTERRGSRRQKLSLRKNIEKRLALYALGAAATAGVTPAKADIIYTPLNVTIGPNSVYFLDINGQEVCEFRDIHRRLSISLQYGYLTVKGSILGRPQEGLPFALQAGAIIGPAGSFGGPDSMAFGVSSSSRKLNQGAWANVSNRYLGLKFDIAGEVHFGWAELSVTDDFGLITAELSGDAYETVPGEPIAAGQKSQTPEPSTLALLALGACGLGLWRRRKVAKSG